MTDIHDWHVTDKLNAEQGQGDPFAAAVRATRMAMIITDPRQDDNPIVFANAAFLKLTGYELDEVVGRNCRFLQGPDTDPAAVAKIRHAIEARRDVSVDILNYRKDGTSFWNALFLSEVTSGSGSTQFFFASQLDITDRVEAQRLLASQQAWLESEVVRRTEQLETALATQTMLVHEVDHRVKNNIQMITALLSMQANSLKDQEARDLIAGTLRRVEAIGTVHRRLYQAKDVRVFDLADFVDDIARDLVNSSGRTDIALSLDLHPAKVPSQQASPCALMVNELLMNSLRHAFPARGGKLAVTLRTNGDRFTVVIQDDGVGMPQPNGRSGFGTRLIRALARQLQAEVLWKDAAPGTIVELNCPLQQPGPDRFDA